MRILVVEDEAKVARALKEGLESEHYQVAIARTGQDGHGRVRVAAGREREQRRDDPTCAADHRWPSSPSRFCACALSGEPG